MFDVVGIGLNAIDYLVGVPRFPVPGEKLRMSSFAREGGGQVATALVALSRWGSGANMSGMSETTSTGGFPPCSFPGGGRPRPRPDGSRRLVPVRGDSRGGRNGRADHPVGPGSEDPGITGRPAAGRHPASAGPPSRRPRRPTGDSRGEDRPGRWRPGRSRCGKGAGGDGGTSVPVRSHRGRGTLPGAAPPRNLGGRWRPGDPAPLCTQDVHGYAWPPRGVRMRRTGRDLLASHPRRGGGHTGAGDIFHAGFLYSLLRGLPFREILAFANTAAGLSCRGMGGGPRSRRSRRSGWPAHR